MTGAGLFKSGFMNPILDVSKITKKWAKTGLLDNIDDDYNKRVVAVLLENQRLSNESAMPGNNFWLDK